MQAALLLVRVLFVILAFGASLLSFGLFMAATGDNNIGFVARIWALYFGSAFVIGASVSRWWYCAIAVAWLPLVMLPVLLINLLSGQMFQQSAADQIGIGMFAVSPAIALLAGFLGGKASSSFGAWVRG